MSRFQILTTIAIIALATLLTRAAPFLVFSGKSEPPAFVKYLGKVLPSASLGLLVVYCLKDYLLDIQGNPAAWIAAFVTAAVQLIKRSALLSILTGTAVYMILSAVMK